MNRLALALLALTLGACSTPQAPNPIAPAVKVNLQPVKDRVVVIDKTNKDIGAKLDAAIIAANDAKIELEKEKFDKAQVQKDVDSINLALAEAKSKQQEQEGYIMALKLEANAASDQADNAFIAATEAVKRANTAEGKVYKFELQEKEDEGNWGLNGVWRWTKHLGWRVIFLIVGIGIITIALRLFAPAVIPIFTGIWAGILWGFRAFASLIKRVFTGHG